MRGRFGLAATMTAVAAVLCAGCAPAGSAGAGHSPPSPAPYPADTGSAPSGGAESLWAVAALGESDAWAVGTHTPLPRGTYPLTEHWDGQRWRAVPCPSPGGTAEPARSSLEAVAIDAPDDAWAVGHWSPIEHVPPSYGLIEPWHGRGRPGGDLRPRHLGGGGFEAWHPGRALGRFEVDDRADAERVQGPDQEQRPVRRQRLVQHQRLGRRPISVRSDQPGHEHAGGALGRRAMATAAESERPPRRPGGT